MKPTKKVLFVSGALALVLGLGVVSRAPVSDVAHAETLPETSLTSTAYRADSSNPGGGAGPTVNVYTANTGSITAKNFVDLPCTIYDQTAGKTADFSVQAAVYAANARFIVDFPDAADSTKTTIGDTYVMIVEKGTAIADSATLAHDWIMTFKFYVVNSDTNVIGMQNVTSYFPGQKAFEETTTVASVYNSTWSSAEGYWKFNLSVNDVDSLSSYAKANSMANWSLGDYNFLTHILFSNTQDGDYIPLAGMINYAGGFYFKEGASWRLPMAGAKVNDAVDYSVTGSFKFVKILQGCQFPSYEYCNGGDTAKCFVTAEDQLYFTDTPANAVVGFAEVKDNGTINDVDLGFKYIAGGWNNLASGTNSQVILQMYTDASDSVIASSPSTCNLAGVMGDYVTLNGVPFADLTGSVISFRHGNWYVYLVIPYEYLVSAPGYDLPTIVIKAGAYFQGHYLPQITMTYSKADGSTDGTYTVTDWYTKTVSFNGVVETEQDTLVQPTYNRVFIYLDYKDETLIPDTDYGVRIPVSVENVATGTAESHNVIPYVQKMFLIDGWLNTDGSSDGTYKLTFKKGASYRYCSITGYRVGFAEDVSFYVYVTGAHYYVASIASRTAIADLVTNNLHMNDYDASLTGTGDGSCTTYYAAAKTAFNAMSEHQRKIFCNAGEYANAYARLVKWASLNGDTISSNKIVSARVNNSIVANSGVSTVTVVAVLSVVTLIGAAVLLKKKRHD